MATFSSAPSGPNFGAGRRRDGGAHPVLARIPDVASPPPAKQRAAQAAAAGFVDYRFDNPASDNQDAASRHHEAQPHMFRRRASGERSPSFGASRVLPDSDPFAIPGSTLAERLVPAVRFLGIFMLVTAVGTFVLSTRRNVPDAEPVSIEPAAVTAPVHIEQSLEPAPIPDHPTIASPTALGPLGLKAKNPTQYLKSAPETTLLPMADFPNEYDPFSEVDAPPTSVSTPNHGTPLPSLQTTDPPAATPALADDRAPAHRPSAAPQEPSQPPAIARLPGVIFEAPRHAYHDNNQPGLH